MTGRRLLSMLLAAALCLALAAPALASGEPEEDDARELIDPFFDRDVDEPLPTIAPDDDAEEPETPDTETAEETDDTADEDADESDALIGELTDDEPGPEIELEAEEEDDTDDEIETAADPWRAAQILLHSVGLPAGDLDEALLDTNGDGTINAADAALLLPCCGDPDTPYNPEDPYDPSDPGVPDEPDEPHPDVDADFTWNGQKEIWAIVPTTAAFGLTLICDKMGELMEAYDWTYVLQDAHGDPTEQCRLVDEAASSGTVGALFVAAMDVDALEAPVARAIEAGIAVMYLGAEPDYPIAGHTYSAYELTGYYAVLAAEDWAKNAGAQLPADENGRYEVAADTYYDIRDGRWRSQAMIGTIEKSDILTLVSETSAYGMNSEETAYQNALDVLKAHPDCHIFIAYEPEEALGIARALAEYCKDNGLSLADYCVISCYAESDAFTQAYEAALEDPAASAIKGYSTYGDPVVRRGCILFSPMELLGFRLADMFRSVCEGVTDDEPFTYGGAYYDRVIAKNILGFSLEWHNGDENPAAIYKY